MANTPTPMEDLNEQLRRLAIEACQHSVGSLKRQQCLTQIIRLTAHKLWRERTPYYADALQQTWVYFCQNLCKSYDPDRASIVTWLNAYLKFRLRDGFIAQIDKQKKEVPFDPTADSDEAGVVQQLVAPEPEPPPILEQVRQWVEADLTGELRRLHIQGHPEVNCQTLILRRLTPESAWKELSTEFNIPIPSLSAFYQRQCLPRLRNFGESNGYL